MAIKSTMPISLARSALAIALGLFLFGPASADAAPINYGDFSGSTVMYLDVTETANTAGDSEPLYGPPSITSNKLDFDPAGFAASATSGSSDLTDGQLNFTLMSMGTTIKSITFSEGGDYSLLGTGSAATLINYALAVGSISVLEVDGVALASPVALAGASSSGQDDLSAGPESLASWSLSLAYDVDAALLSAGVPFEFGATKLELAIDDQLAAISELSSIAYIAKKDFMIDVTTVPIPEPSTAALLGLVLCAVGAARRIR